MSMKMKRMRSFPLRMILGVAALLVAAAAPAWAQPPYPPPPGPGPGPGSRYYHADNDRFGEFRLWAGGFQPDAHGVFWDNEFHDFTGSRNDFRDVIGGGDFIYHFDRFNAIMFSASFYSGTANQAFRNFLDQDNNRIRHDTNFDIASGSVAYVLFPAGTHTPVIPYLGAGVGIYSWRLRETGQFIDFNHNNEIFTARLENTGTAFGYFFLAGIEIPLTRHLAVLVDGRYTKAHDTLSGDFAGFGRLDLSGGQITGGISFHL